MPVQTLLERAQEFLGPVTFYSLIASVPMALYRRLPPWEALTAAFASLCLAWVFANPMAEFVSSRGWVSYEGAIALSAGTISLIGRDGTLRILSMLLTIADKRKR